MFPPQLSPQHIAMLSSIYPPHIQFQLVSKKNLFTRLSSIYGSVLLFLHFWFLRKNLFRCLLWTLFSVFKIVAFSLHIFICHFPLWSLCCAQACQLLLQQQQQQQQQQQPSQQQQILQNQRKFMPNVRQQTDPQQVHCQLKHFFRWFPYSFCEANDLKKMFSPSWPGSWLCYSNTGNSRLGF